MATDLSDFDSSKNGLVIGAMISLILAGIAEIALIVVNAQLLGGIQFIQDFLREATTYRVIFWIVVGLLILSVILEAVARSKKCGNPKHFRTMNILSYVVLGLIIINIIVTLVLPGTVVIF